MNNYTFTKNGTTFERITKATAKKLYNSGVAVYLMPANANPFFVGFSYPYATSTSTNDGMTFDACVNAFEYYNCNAEMGKYTAFFKAI